MINPAKLFKIKSSWDKFTENHPKFPQFISAVQSTGIAEGTVIEVNITTPEGKTLSTNVKITGSDKEMFEELAALSKTM